MDQADHGRRAALGQSVGRAAVRLDLLHDHRLPRHPRDDRRDLPADHRPQGLARRLRPRTTAASSPAARATTRSSRSWASTGTSSISSGCSSSRSSICGEGTTWHTMHAHAHATRSLRPRHAEGQQHPIKLYLVVWGWLFVLSTCSYLVDYFHLQGYLRWSLILLFMMLKAGLIVAVFMHMAWERLALLYAILLPPLAGAGVRRHHGVSNRTTRCSPGVVLCRASLTGGHSRPPRASRRARATTTSFDPETGRVRANALPMRPRHDTERIMQSIAQSIAATRRPERASDPRGSERRAGRYGEAQRSTTLR